jgi:prolyl-tRNA synthetase
VEQSHDENGIIWPLSVAPFHVHLIPVSVKDESQTRVAEELYNRLRESGVEVLMDDRDERPGVKFKDADLIGIPLRVTVGKGAADGRVEFKQRKDDQQIDLTVEEALTRILQTVRKVPV